MRLLWAIALLIVLAPLVALTANAGDCGSPTDLHDGWTVTAPENEGLDPTLICGIGPRLGALEDAKAHGIVIARHGRLVYEHYFTGNDWRLGMPLGEVKFDAGTKHDIRSISKSVTSLLVGIALDRGLLTDLDAPVFSFFPDYSDVRTPGKDRITLRHLLTMSSGLAWDETSVSFRSPSNIMWQMAAAPRSDRFVLEQPLAASPGTVFNYNGGSTDLLGTILRKLAGKRLDEFAKETLLEPLGIEDWDWDGGCGFNPSAASGLRLRPRDLAKIGQLVLERGNWHGHQIVPSSWIKDSTTPRLSGKGVMFGNPVGITSYGYLWWLGRSPPEHPERDLIAGAGFGGQRLFILPSLDMVVVITAGLYAEADRDRANRASAVTDVMTLHRFVFPAAIAH